MALAATLWGPAAAQPTGRLAPTSANAEGLRPSAERIWHAGDALERALARSVSVAWSGVPRREAVHGLSRSHGVAVVLDRRIDPSRQLDFAIEDVPLSEAFHALAQAVDAGVTQLDSLLYIGPPEAAKRLRTLAALRQEDVDRLGGAAKAAFSRLRPWRWADLTTPRDLLTELAQELGLQVAHIERMPHDLWAGCDLPPLRGAARLTLLCAQFDLTFQLADGGRRIALEAIPEQVLIQRAYSGGTNPAATARRIAARLPGCDVQLSGRRVIVRALLEDHERLASTRRREHSPANHANSDGATVKRHSFRARGVPLAYVLDELSTRLDLVIRWDTSQISPTDAALKTLVSVNVENATLDELLERVFSGTGLRFDRDGLSVNVLRASAQ